MTICRIWSLFAPSPFVANPRRSRPPDLALHRAQLAQPLRARSRAPGRGRPLDLAAPRLQLAQLLRARSGAPGRGRPLDLAAPRFQLALPS